ncbi:MAG: gamma-glutamyltransferase [Cyanobacteria bacterium P01_F01_bin.86]
MIKAVWICGAFVALGLSSDSVLARVEDVQSRSDIAKTGMVVSAHPLATQTGLQTLKKGGNAVDAAVATTLAISVVEPFSAGIGGGGFLLYHQESDHTVRALDFRERAPLKANRDLYVDAQGQIRPGQSINGHLAVATPGTIAGLAEVHRQYGTLPWEDLVQPSIELAQSGFVVSDRFARMARFRQNVLVSNPAARKIFTHQGKPIKSGDRLIQTDLAKTLRLIAKDPDAFYRGPIARLISKDMKRNGGLITKQDLRTYKTAWRSPVCGSFQVWEVCSMPPPSSGGVHLIQLLNFWQQRHATPPPRFHPDTLHFMAETMRTAYADRAVYLGDPDFVRIPVPALISPLYTLNRGNEVGRTARSSQSVMAASPQLIKRLQESEDTSHLTVVDRDRNAVSLTFTVNLGFGAGVVAEGTGIVLNNEMDDFASAPGQPNAFGLVGSEANAIAPRKTPLSSMTPTIVRDQSKSFRLALGAPGGSTIITTVYQTLLNTLVYKMSAHQAIASPRIHHQWLPDRLSLEEHSSLNAAIAPLEKKGHRLRLRSAWGNGNLIYLRPDGMLEGAADPRGEGTAVGYSQEARH